MGTAAAEQALQGHLKEVSLAGLLRSLTDDGRTGSLSLATGGEIWMSEGRLYLVSTGSGSTLSAVLFGADLGDLDEIEQLFGADSPDADGSVLDRILSDRPEREGLICRLLHEYNLNGLFELLVPSDTRFWFEPGRVHRLGDRLAHDTENLLAQAEHRIEIWRRIASRIPSTASQFRLAPSLPGTVFERAVGVDEWKFLACLDGQTTVADVITSTGESAFRVCSVLYRLLLEGLIEESETSG